VSENIAAMLVGGPKDGMVVPLFGAQLTIVVTPECYKQHTGREWDGRDWPRMFYRWSAIKITNGGDHKVVYLGIFSELSEDEAVHAIMQRYTENSINNPAKVQPKTLADLHHA
jgi:hypothetical protein